MFAITLRCEDSYLNEGISNEDCIPLIAEAGFDKVFISLQNVHIDDNYHKYMKLIKSNNLGVSFVHLGYRVDAGINTLWEEGKDGDTLIDNYINDISIIAKDGINLVCMHLTKSSKTSDMNEVGLNRIRKLVKHAEKIGVTIALENTRWPGYIEFVMDNIDSPNLAICYDSGHCHCFFDDKFDFVRFKDKIKCLHLHDNHGEKDEHLIPGDGSIDWDELMNNLSIANYNGDITSEAVYSKQYLSITPLDFYREVYKRLVKLSKKIEK